MAKIMKGGFYRRESSENRRQFNKEYRRSQRLIVIDTIRLANSTNTPEEVDPLFRPLRGTEGRLTW